MAVPKIEKISINIGMGEATRIQKLIDGAVQELTPIAGQKPIVTKAKKSIAAFKLREGMSIGAWSRSAATACTSFFDRLMTVALPRVRDFRGVSAKSFDGRGNYTLGIKDQLIFPEIDYNKVEKTKGMNITITTTAKTDAEGLALLRHLGMPFSAVTASTGLVGTAKSEWQQPQRSRETKNWPPRRRTRRRNWAFAIATAASSADGPAAIIRKFTLCRICFRKLALAGEIPGVTKSSW